MSWDAYVDSVCGDGAIITQATIIGLDGSIWTPKTKDKIMNISAAEASAISKAMKPKNETVKDYFAGSGIVIDGQKYMFLKDVEGDGRIMTGKKSKIGGIVLQSTAQGVIIAFVPEEKGEGAIRSATGPVGNIAKYLEDSGY